MEAKVCKECGSVLGPKNRSGYCRKHFSCNALSPDHGAKISAAQKRKYRADPLAREAAAERARRAGRLPQSVEARRRSAIERRIWEKGLAAVTPEHRRKAAARCSATRLAWCPSELRGEYLRLIYSSRVKKVDAQRMILEQHEKDMARFREGIGETPNGPKPRPIQYTPSDIEPSSAVLEIQAKRQRIDALRVNRDPCSLCGVRADHGCDCREAA